MERQTTDGGALETAIGRLVSSVWVSSAGWINGGTMAEGVVCTLRIVNGTPASAANPCPASATCLPCADFSTGQATISSAPVGGAGAATIAGFTIGGWNSGLTIGNTNSTTFCPGATGCGAAMLPELTTWNNGGGGTPNLPRVQLGAVVEAPFIYIFGGSTVSAATSATQSTERTVW